jgi:hypothetical protein
MLKVAMIVGALLLTGLAAPAGAAWPGPAQTPACQASEGRVDIEGRQCVVSPDGLRRVVVDRGRITVEENGNARAAGVMDNGDIAWNVASTGFVVADSGGSGQTSFFSYVDVRQKVLHRDKRLRLAAVQRYAARFKCSGRKVQVHAWFSGWEDDRRVRLSVQEGVHSEGCVHSDTEAIQIGFIANVVTGRIEQVLTQAQFQKWCAPDQRPEYGLCLVPPEPVY